MNILSIEVDNVIGAQLVASVTDSNAQFTKTLEIAYNTGCFYQISQAAKDKFLKIGFHFQTSS